MSRYDDARALVADLAAEWTKAKAEVAAADAVRFDSSAKASDRTKARTRSLVAGARMEGLEYAMRAVEDRYGFSLQSLGAPVRPNGTLT